MTSVNIDTHDDPGVNAGEDPGADSPGPDSASSDDEAGVVEIAVVDQTGQAVGTLSLSLEEQSPQTWLHATYVILDDTTVVASAVASARVGADPAKDSEGGPFADLPEIKSTVVEYDTGDFERLLNLDQAIGLLEPGLLTTWGGSSGLLDVLSEELDMWGVSNNFKLVPATAGRVHARWWAHKHFDANVDGDATHESFVAYATAAGFDPVDPSDLTDPDEVGDAAVVNAKILLATVLRDHEATLAAADPIRLSEPGELPPIVEDDQDLGSSGLDRKSAKPSAPAGF